jgi:hypothetical protein
MDCPVECFLIGLRRLRRPRYLPHILQSRIMHLRLTRRRLKVVQRANVSTHPPILPDADDRTLRQAQGAYSRALLESAALCSVGLTVLTPEAKTLESSPAQDRTQPQTRTTPSGVSTVSPTERPKRAGSVRVISAVELVKQTGQRHKAEPEADEHQPPPEDGSEDNGYEGQ